MKYARHLEIESNWSEVPFAEPIAHRFSPHSATGLNVLNVSLPEKTNGELVL